MFYKNYLNCILFYSIPHFSIFLYEKVGLFTAVNKITPLLIVRDTLLVHQLPPLLLSSLSSVFALTSFAEHINIYSHLYRFLPSSTFSLANGGRRKRNLRFQNPRNQKGFHTFCS
ncbi:unnamed protein product, partial [Vitis vinifera]|uniref:Uncharacterized protein n=1 Tax=Vitis vinifera TaxID=29760 RepID=D7TU06_VITVI